MIFRLVTANLGTPWIRGSLKVPSSGPLRGEEPVRCL
jgi:hypothetical protein